MGKAVITIKIMPESPDVDLDAIFTQANVFIQEFTGGSDTKKEILPLAFGLKSLNITFLSDEAKGSTDSLEEQIRSVAGVNSCEVTDVRRAIG